MRAGPSWSGGTSPSRRCSADWWTPDDLRVSELVFEATPGGRIVLEYRDVEDADGSDVVVGRAEGVVDDVVPGERLAYRSSPTLPDGSLAFTGHVEIDLLPTDAGTDLDVQFRITDSTVDSAEFIAGIELGFGQSLDKLAAAIAAEPQTHPPHRKQEHEVTEQTGGRRVVANIALSLDGRYAAPDNPIDMRWVVPYATTDVARDHLTSLWEPATTGVMGRVNAEGFLGFWPTVIDMDGADPRDVGFAKWLVNTEKVVFSSSLREAPWERTTLVDKPAAEVIAELKGTEGGDIWVLSSASIIKALLAADQVDRLALVIAPVFLGGGPRLFDDGLPTGQWTLASQAAGDQGTLCLVYDRVR